MLNFLVLNQALKLCTILILVALFLLTGRRSTVRSTVMSVAIILRMSPGDRYQRN